MINTHAFGLSGAVCRLARYCGIAALVLAATLGGRVYAQSNNADLQSVSGSITRSDGTSYTPVLIPSFHRTITEYTIVAEAGDTGGWFFGSKSGGLGNVSLRGPRNGVLNRNGITTFVLRVTAPDGVTRKHYTFSIYHLVPTPPRDVTASVGGESLLINWRPPASNGGSDIIRHKIRWDVDTHSGYRNTLDIAASTTQYTIPALIGGRAYRVQVAAVTATGSSGWSPAIIGTPAVSGPLTALALTPAAVLNPGFAAHIFRYTATTTAASLALTPTFRGSGVTATAGLRGGSANTVTSGNASMSIPLTLGENTLEIAVGTSVDKSIYTFVITRINLAKKPDVPRNLRLSSADAQLMLEWSAPASNGGADITQYRVRWAPAGSGAPVWANPSGANGHVIPGGATLAYTLSGLSNGMAYRVEVSAENRIGIGDWSAAQIATPDTLPSVPVDFRVQEEDGQLLLAWTPPDAGSATLTGYRYRWSNDGDDANWENPVGEAGDIIEGGADARSLTLTGFTNGATYRIQIAAVNIIGLGAWSAFLGGSPGRVPGPPNHPGLRSANAQLTLVWTAPVDNGGHAIAHYEVRWAVAGTTDWLNTGGENGRNVGIVVRSFDITGLSNTLTYQVQVRAVNKFGAGVWASIRETPATPPGPPGNLRIVSTQGTLQIFWGEPADTGDAVISGYRIRWAVAGTTDWINRDGGDGLLVGSLFVDRVISSLTDGVTYEIGVAAVNAAGSSRFASIRGIPASKTGAPRDVTIEISDRTLRLSWRAPANNGGAAVSGYRVRWAQGANSIAWIDPPGEAGRAVTGATQTDLTDLTNGAVYEVQVAAINPAGTGPFSGSTRGIPAAKPGAPRDVRIEISDRALRLSWTAPANNGGAAVSSYRVRWAQGADSKSWTDPPGAAGLAVVSATQTDLTDLTNGTVYEVQVAAVNAAGTGSFSASTRGTPATKPSAPGNLRIQRGSGRLALSWTAPVDSGGYAITDYAVRWAKGAGSTLWVRPPGAIWRSTGSATAEYNLTGLESATTYEVQVAARNAVGIGTWSVSARGATTSFELDVNQSGAVDWRDGALIARYMLGVRGEALTAGLGDSLSAENIGAQVNAGILAGDLDIDGAGGTTAADGIMLARYLLNVRGDSLTAGMSSVMSAKVIERIMALLPPDG